MSIQDALNQNDGPRMRIEQLEAAYAALEKEWQVERAEMGRKLTTLRRAAKIIEAKLIDKETELTAVRGMLDRIAAVVVDRFDPKSEECIADGVDSLVDELTAVRGELESESAWAETYHSNQVQLEKQVETLTKERDEARALMHNAFQATRETREQLTALQKAVGEAVSLLRSTPCCMEDNRCWDALIALKETPTPPQDSTERNTDEA